MHPSTPHFVVNVTDCLSFGGHYFNNGTLVQTLTRMLSERYFGRYITNSSMSQYGFVLVKMLCSYADLVERWAKLREWEKGLNIYLWYHHCAYHYCRSNAERE